jgi:putative nucleotidyltransferase with HDIG domain
VTMREKILKGVRTVSPLPAVAARLAVMMRDRDVEIGTLGEVVQYDPGITAKVIGLANSARFGAGRQILTLKDALVRIGLDELYRLVFVSSLAPVMRRPVEGYDLAIGQLWRHCVATALAAEAVEEYHGKVAGSGVAFTAGLLHDVGKLVMDSLSEDYFMQIEQKADQDEKPFDEAEREILGIDHTEAGALVLEQWGFPAEMVDVVRCHHQPEKATVSPHLASVVHVADMVAMMMGVGVGRDALGYRASADSLAAAGLTRQGVEVVAFRMLGKLEEIEKKFTENGQ